MFKTLSHSVAKRSPPSVAAVCQFSLLWKNCGGWTICPTQKQGLKTSVACLRGKRSCQLPSGTMFTSNIPIAVRAESHTRSRMTWWWMAGTFYHGKRRSRNSFNSSSCRGFHFPVFCDLFALPVVIAFFPSMVTCPTGCHCVFFHSLVTSPTGCQCVFLVVLCVWRNMIFWTKCPACPFFRPFDFKKK